MDVTLSAIDPFESAGGASLRLELHYCAYLFIASKVMPQWGQRDAASVRLPWAAQKPALPKDWWQLGQGIRNRFQNTAPITAAMSTPRMNRSSKFPGPGDMTMPATRRKAMAPTADRLANRLTYWRIVIIGDFTRGIEARGGAAAL